jgi:hypothetical protein
MRSLSQSEKRPPSRRASTWLLRQNSAKLPKLLVAELVLLMTLIGMFAKQW